MTSHRNHYLSSPLGLVYVRTALPIIFVMGMNGLLAVVDALFLGHFAGPAALAAVTLMFPPYMLVVALATLVSSGMSSILARHLGAWRVVRARDVFAASHGLALFLGSVLIGLFLAFGEKVAFLAAGGSAPLAEMGLIYLRITVFSAPLIFVLSINSDALRNEGLVGFMAGMSLLVSVSNMAFNYILIGLFDMGVAGSAYGTVLAQGFALVIILSFRAYGETGLPLASLKEHSLLKGWGRILALGVPQSLNFAGFALGSSAIILALQWVDTASYENTVSAYGVITRVVTFAFLPLLGLAHAMQTITGNNFGAGHARRCADSLKLAVMASVIYCGTVQFWVSAYAVQIGAAFVTDIAVINEVARLLPVFSATFCLAGPLMMIAMHFQAIGDARRAALLGLSKPYLFAIPLTFILAGAVGEFGIWLSAPFADIMLCALTAWVLFQLSRRQSLKSELFSRPLEAEV